MENSKLIITKEDEKENDLNKTKKETTGKQTRKLFKITLANPEKIENNNIRNNEFDKCQFSDINTNEIKNNPKKYSK